MMRVLAYMSSSAPLVAALCLIGFAGPARAQADDAIDAWARWAVAPKVWKGQTVLVPEPSLRPAGLGLRLDSRVWPVRVHAARDSSGTQGGGALLALEHAYGSWQERGWPMPAPDGGVGGSLAFDAYLFAGAGGAQRCEGRVDGAVVWADFDTAYTHAVVDAALPLEELSPCVHSAFAQAALRALDPAEAESTVRASAEFLAWLDTGEPGCAGSMVAAQQAPERSPLGADAAAAGAGALLLALLSERHDGGSGHFVRALWELTRQRSRGLVDADRLRGSPDLWEVLAQALPSSGESLSDAIAEFGVARYFSGSAVRRSAAAYRVLSSLPPEAGVPLLADLSLGELPRHVRTAAPGGVESLGSAYVRVRMGGQPPSGELRVWLRAELGPDWSLSALRLAADGRELGRTRSAARRVPESYLPVMLEPETSEVVLVITHLPASTPDPDEPVLAPHGFDLALAHAAP